MPRYYFHFTDGKRVCSDGDGLDLPDDEAARKEAKLEACDLQNDPWGECDWSGWTIRVVDQNGRYVTSRPVGHGWSILRLVSGLGQRLTGIVSR